MSGAAPFKSGDRVLHTKYGPGTVQQVDGGRIEVELDSEPGKSRTFIATLGVLSREDGKPLPATAAPPPPETTAMPTDDLLAAMDRAIGERGLEAADALASACGLKRPSLKNWRRAGRIPEQHRATVQAWIVQPAASAAMPAAKPTQGKARAAAPQRLAGMPKAPALVDLRALLGALGFKPAAMYVVEDGKLVECMAVRVP